MTREHKEEIVIDAFKVAIEAARKVDRTEVFRCIYEGYRGRRLNKEIDKMEPCPDTACAEDVPEDVAGLRKYFEPNFKAMLIDHTGDADNGNLREDWNITGTGLGKTSVEPRLLHNQASRYLRGKGMRMQHKEVQDMKTVQPVAMSCTSNKLCPKELTGALAYKSSKMEQDMMAKGHNSVKNMEMNSFRVLS